MEEDQWRQSDLYKIRVALEAIAADIHRIADKYCQTITGIVPVHDTPPAS